MEYKKTYQKIEIRSLVITIVLIFLFIFRQIIIQRQINFTKDMSTVVNVSGRQRMLSQRISKTALILHENSDDRINKYYIEELETSLNTFVSSHRNLQSRNIDEGSIMTNCEKVGQLFQEIEPDFNQIEDSGYRVLEWARQGNPVKEEVLKDLENMILSERAFLEKMDEIVFHYDLEAKDNILVIKRLEQGLFYVIMLVILLIVLLIFRPAVKTLRYAFVEINENNENMTKLFNTMKGAMFIVNEEGEIKNSNSGAVDIIRIQEDELPNASIITAVNWLNINIKKMIKDVSNGGEITGIEVKVEDKHDNVLTLLLSVTKGKFNRKEIVLIPDFLT